jgi:type VI protein secretion system component VasF
MASYNREARSGEGEQLWLQTIEQLGISSEAVTALRYFLATVHDDTAAALEAVAEILYADHLSD